VHNVPASALQDAPISTDTEHRPSLHTNPSSQTSNLPHVSPCLRSDTHKFSKQIKGLAHKSALSEQSLPSSVKTGTHASATQTKSASQPLSEHPGFKLFSLSFSQALTSNAASKLKNNVD
jgi:hypothetical protein